MRFGEEQDFQPANENQQDKIDLSWIEKRSAVKNDCSY